jgi:5'-nucleotidase
VSGVNLGRQHGRRTRSIPAPWPRGGGFLLGIPALAISLTSKAGEHFESAIGVALELVERLRRDPPARAVLLQRERADVAPARLAGSRSPASASATRPSR